MDKQKKQLLIFGYGCTIIFSFFGIRWVLESGWNFGNALLLIMAAALFLISFFRVESVKPIYTVWMKIAFFIGTTVTATILSVVFYLIFGFVGVLLRILKKDLLDRDINPAINSYWGKKESPPFDKKRYTQQF